MKKSDREALEELCRDADEAQALFSNKGQDLQERTAVAGLLRVLGVNCREEEIIKQNPAGSVDVRFRNACFQVTEILDQGSVRNREMCWRADRIRNANRLQDLVEPGVISSNPMPPDELLALVLERTIEKAKKYGNICTGIDLLIYINLRKRHLYPLGPLPGEIPDALTNWRSVAVLMEPVALVLWVAEDAPGFLRSHNGQVVRWPGPDSMFPKLADIS